MPHPYGFVPVSTDANGVANGLVDELIFHDGRKASEDLLSGELLCTLDVLTPLLAANDQYSASEIIGAMPDAHDPNQVFLPPSWGLNFAVKKDKTILEPLRLRDGRIVIVGTALKGMLRQSIGALFGAPMERVSERNYSYRPNIAFASAHAQVRREPRPAVVEKWDPVSQMLHVKVLPPGAVTRTVFVRDEAVPFLGSAAPSPGASKSGIFPGVRMEPGPGGSQRLVVDATRSATLAHRYFRYAGGVDGIGDLAAAFLSNGGAGTGRVYHHVLIEEGDYVRGLVMVVPKEVLDIHKATCEHLADRDFGHLRNEHPLSEKFKGRIDAIKKGCSDSSNVIRDPDFLIYVEVELDHAGRVTGITSIGQNFRYRWRYADTVRTRKTSTGREERSILTPLAREQPTTDRDKKNQSPERLSAARLLFGYVADAKNGGVAGIGTGDHRQLAGRVAINMAVECLAHGVDGRSNSRFLAADHECAVPLKILGAPKPGAVENYLDQSNLQARRRAGRDNARHVTYGDVPGVAAGDLAGRKFYRHQPAAAINQACYLETNAAIVAGNQAAIARFVSPPGSRFRFSLRFQDLRRWELGAIVACLNPETVLDGLTHLAPAIRNELNTAPQVQPAVALKLGHGRPLGMGSVKVTIDAVRILNADFTIRDGAVTKQEALLLTMNKLGGIDPKIIEAWLSVQRYRGLTRFDYPRANDGTIFGYHTAERRAHARGRRERV